MVLKLYISDLDGTLLNNKGTLSLYTRQALLRILREGVHFTLASARSMIAMQAMLKGLPMKLPVVDFNGAFISDLRTGKHLAIYPMDSEVALEIFEMANVNGIAPFVSTFNGKEDCLYYPENMNRGMYWYYRDRHTAGDPRLRKLEEIGQTFSEQVICLTLIDRQEKVFTLVKDIQSMFAGGVVINVMENQYARGWFWLTVHDRRATKDQAIMTLMEEYGYSRENLTVFGDNTNDIKMFQIAARAVAVENAVAELKEYATEIIQSNEEDGVVKYIMRDTGLL